MMWESTGRASLAVDLNSIHNMHPDTIAALRLLALALDTHPEDIEVLTDYGNIPEHLVDAVDDYCDGDDE